MFPNQKRTAKSPGRCRPGLDNTLCSAYNEYRKGHRQQAVGPKLGSENDRQFGSWAVIFFSRKDRNIMKTNVKKLVPALIVLAVLIAVFWGVYRQFSPKAQSGEKQITLSIVDDTGTQTDYPLNTDAEYLLEALQSVAEIDGEESPEYGYTLYTVNGLTADFTTGNAYWAIYVNGEYGSYGLSQQPVTDGDTYAIVYETYAA